MTKVKQDKPGISKVDCPILNKKQSCSIPSFKKETYLGLGDAETTSSSTQEAAKQYHLSL